MGDAIRVIDRVQDMSDWDQSTVADNDFVQWDDASGKYVGVTITSADLPATIAYKDVSNTFTEDQIIEGNLTTVNVLTGRTFNIGNTLTSNAVEQHVNIGLDNTISSTSINCFIFGLGDSITGTAQGTVVGISNSISTSGSAIVFGQGCSVTGASNSGALGFSSTVSSGDSNFAIGNGSTISGGVSRSFAFGTLCSVVRSGVFAYCTPDHNPIINLQRFSDNDTVRNLMDITASWATSTDASRKARIVHYVYDTNAREAFRIEADGSNPMIGFLGASAVVRPEVTGSTGSNAALQSLLTALETLGLITDSTT